MADHWAKQIFKKYVLRRTPLRITSIWPKPKAFKSFNLFILLIFLNLLCKVFMRPIQLGLCTIIFFPAYAQNIEGHIQDSLGRPLVGVQINLQNAQGGILSTAQTNEKGIYSFKDLHSGTYALEAQKPGFSTGVGISVVDQTGSTKTDITLASEEALEIDLFANLVETQRIEVSSKTGGSKYHLTAKDIDQLPQGDGTPLNQVLLDAPGVVNDSYGQIHVRGEHANVQYQVNGVTLPQGLSGFGQNLDTRFAQSVDLLTGALPAQYGFNTAGVVDITTKSKIEESGSMGIYAGSYRTLNPSFQYGGSNGDTSYFWTGSFLTNNSGIENPNSNVTPYHDLTHQGRGFGYISYLVDSTTKLSLMGGTYSGAFQIPNNPDQPWGGKSLRTGVSGNPSVTFDSINLNDQQFERNEFLVLSIQKSVNDNINYQTSIFTNYSTTHYLPDTIGNLYFNGVASNVLKSSETTGLQSDATYKLDELHTLKLGMIGRVENVSTRDDSSVYQLTPGTTNISGSGPISITDDSKRNGNLQIGIYAQDAWAIGSKLTLNYGLRYDYFSAFVSGNQLSPRLGFVFKPSDSTTVHTGYSHYYTPPPNELVSTTTQSAFANTTNAIPGLNSSVKAESGDYYDIGIKQKVNQNYSTGIDAYLKNTQNTLDEGQFGPALILTPFNYAYGKIYGLEWSNTVKIGNLSTYLNISDNVSLARSIISSQYLFDQQTLTYASNNWVNVDHEQTHSLTAGGTYRWRDIHFSASMIYASGLRNGFANTGTLSPYTVLNLGASKTIQTIGLGPLEYRLVINNALDHVYEIRDGSGIGIYAPQYGQRRAIYTGITKRF